MRYRCRPVEVDAVRATVVTDGVKDAMPEWLVEAMSDGTVSLGESGRVVRIKTLEGHVVTPAESWVVRGALGEIWPVQDAQFEHKYEAVESA